VQLFRTTVSKLDCFRHAFGARASRVAVIESVEFIVACAKFY
jgi:hypothetical protein